jgi:cell division transport system permease protein
MEFEMSNNRFVVKTMFYTIRLSVIALLCACCILVFNHFYHIKRYSMELLKDLNIFIFFDKDFEDDVSHVDKLIQATGIVVVKEYVNAQNAHLKAVEKNPFLKSIFVPEISKSFQSYAVVGPKHTPNEKFLSSVKCTLEKIHGVDEIVFNVENFKQYVKIENLLLFYRKIFFIFFTLILILTIYKCVFFTATHSSNIRKVITNIFSCIVSSLCGFLILWIVCIYTQYPLLIDNVVVLLLIIPFVTSVGVLLE